jgi:hypothetical protein
LFCALQNHQVLSSLPPLPEGGEVDGRIVVTDDSQESSLPESEAAESQKSPGSSEKETESEQHSDSSHSISPPPATSTNGCKRKRDNVDDSSTPSFPTQLPKNLPRRKKAPSTPSPTLVLLARKLLFFVFVYLFMSYGTLIFCSVAILTGLPKGQRKRNPRFMEQLLRAIPTPWFFQKKTVLLRKLRLPQNIAQKRQLPCPAPERLQRRKLELGLVALKKLL